MPAERFTTLDGRPTVRIEREYQHPIDKVWRAVTTAEHLGQWFPTPVDMDLQLGGRVRFAGFEGTEGAGVVEELDPPRRLTFTWGGDRLTFELTDLGNRTGFVLIHAFDDRYGAPSFAAGWDACLAGLRSVLASEPVASLPPDRHVARHEQLVHEFGLDAPEVTGADDGDAQWTVRFERQLTCPAEVAWDLWFGKDIQTGDQRRAPGVGEPLTPYQQPDLVVGTVTDLEPQRVLGFDVSPDGGPGDHVRLELTQGTGHGARAILTITGTDPTERDDAAQVWGDAIAHLGKCGADWAMTQPMDA